MPGMSGQPIELILARNLLASLSTPAFLVDAPGEIVFYNEAAGALLGRRFEEMGRMPAEQWTSTFGPFDSDGNAIPYEELPLRIALRGNQPAHSRFHIHTFTGESHEIESSAVPLVGTDGFEGAMVIFWPVGDGAAA